MYIKLYAKKPSLMDGKIRIEIIINNLMKCYKTLKINSILPYFV